jgi:RNA polymerase subunit RPABC4/transcription elongation factor Spt4
VDFNGLILAGVTILSAVIVALTIGMILWTFRDMRSRSRDVTGAIAAAAMVGVLNVAGLLIYLLLRPRETLAEAYERSLEEESLLQGIEEKALCLACGRPAKDRWQVCPHCLTQLKKPCPSCGELLDLAWTICPVCTAPQAVEEDEGRSRRRARG